MYNIIALMGSAGSGKDYLLHALTNRYPDLHEVVSCTTRAPREGEVDGVNYHFLSEPLDVSYSIFMEYAIFNTWVYGTRWQDLDENKINVGVWNPTGVRKLLAHQERRHCRVTVFYITAPDKVRMIRQLNRETNPNVDEIVRRWSADRKDFQDLSDIPYIEIQNEGVLEGTTLEQIYKSSF